MRQLRDAPPTHQLEAREPILTLNLGILNLTVGGKSSTTASATTTQAPPPATTPQPTQPTPTPTPTPTPAPRPEEPRPTSTPQNPNSGGAPGSSSSGPQPSNPSTPDQPSGGDAPVNPENPGGSPNDGSNGGTGNGATPGGGSNNENGEEPNGNGEGSPVTGGGNRPSPNNLGSSDFPDQIVGDDGTTTNGGSPNSGGGSGGGGSNSGTGSSTRGPDGTLTQVRGGTTTTTGHDNLPTVIDENGRPVDPEGTTSGFPKGAGIAIGIICALLFLIGLVLLLRRHRKAKREQRAQLWWFSRKRNSKTYADDTHIVQIPPPASARSSFATTFDHSAQIEANFSTANMPALPPMAEIRRSRNDLNYPMTPSPVEPVQGQAQRASVGSAGSHNSQFFFVNHRPSMDTTSDHSTSMHHIMPAAHCTSSPERFAFPKPPSDTSSDRKSGYSDSSTRPQSAASATEETARTFQTPDTSPTPPEHQNLPAFADNPFSDPQPHAAAPQSTQSHATNTTDPFSDSTVSSVAGGHATVEEVLPIPVLRPFTSTLHDEVTLRPGDNVKVLQIFDDGWALIDKLDGSYVAIQRGLCPLACLR